MRTCQPAQQRASPDGDAAQHSAADPELIQQLASELGMLLGDEEGDPEPLLSPEVRACAMISLAGNNGCTEQLSCWCDPPGAVTSPQCHHSTMLQDTTM